MGNERQDRSGLSRRELLRRLGLTGAALAVTPSVLAACGDDEEATTDAPAQSGGGGEGQPAANAEVGRELREILGLEEGPNLGGDRQWKMGSVLALTGAGSFYGKTMTRGTDLAVAHIRAAGGPQISVKYIDHKSGDAQAGVDAMRQLGTEGYPAKLASYADNLGSMLPGTAQYKVFTLDGGGGTSLFAQGQPFFWGTRAITPNDAIPGLMMYLKEAHPEARSLGFIGWDLGEPINGQIRTDILQKFEEGGFEFNGLFELYPVGESNYSTLLPKIKANEPDILIAYGSGQDPGHFASQYHTAGFEAPFYGFEFTPDGVNASKGAYDRYGFTFAADYFDESVGTSDLAKLFVREFEAAYGEPPDFYAANFYENTLVMWEVIRRVIESGGDINSGEDLDAALQEDLTVVSVYGQEGEGGRYGTYTLDETTHSVRRRPLGVFTYKDGQVTPNAFFNIGGEDFRMA